MKKGSKSNLPKKSLLIVLAAILLLAAVVALKVLVFEDEGTLPSGSATLENKDTKEPARNMDPGDSCGNGLCELHEFNYNCPQDC